ncbi:MAG TPA: 50S ribosomal protein L18 [Blastocatellia bacterium]|jgi:large subunit ribosomal protein L18|nr:50S ribosomal protein L18 [Blastocatellia bacterium]
MAKRSRQDVRRAVHTRIRKKVRGDEARPRLAVFRSINHIYAQLINDKDGVTICSASTVEKVAGVPAGGNIDAAKAVGRLIAERAKGKGVTQAVFDRGGYIYHGRVKALAEAAREAGLQF